MDGKKYPRREILGGTISGLGALSGIRWYQEKSIPEKFETRVELYDAIGGEEIPTGENIRSWTKTKENPERFIRPDDPVVQKYMDDIGRYDGGLTVPRLEDFEYVPNSEQCDEGYCWNFPDETLEGVEGNCIDYAIAVTSLMEANDIDSRVVIGNLYQSGSCDSENVEDCEPGLHAISETKIDGDLYVSDNLTQGYVVPKEKYEDHVLEWSPQTMFGDETSYRVYDEDW